METARRMYARARELEQQGRNSEAFEAYRSTAKNILDLMKTVPISESTQMEELGCEMLARARALKNGAPPSVDVDENKMESDLKHKIIVQTPTAEWSDVIGLEDTKQLLERILVIPSRFPQLVRNTPQNPPTMLMFGVPGTGKTLLANALAKHTESLFIRTSSADLVSKFVGESEKMIQLMFSIAASSAPCVVFMDEIDALCTARTEGENEASRRIKTQLLIEMNRLPPRVFLIAATNTPGQLDDGFIRRFTYRVCIPLPDADARAAMLQSYLAHASHCLTDEQITLLAEKTELFNGSDIQNLVRDACDVYLKKLQTARAFRLDESDGLWHMCAEGEAMTLLDIREGQIFRAPVSLTDFTQALAGRRSSVSVKSLDIIANYAKTYGTFT